VDVCNGLGSAQDVMKEFEWIEKSSEQENVIAQNNLGLMGLLMIRE
jgi:TPR repeat protein